MMSGENELSTERQLTAWQRAGLAAVTGALVLGGTSCGSENGEPTPDDLSIPHVEEVFTPEPEPQEENAGEYDEDYDFGAETLGINPDTPVTQIPSLDTLAIMEDPNSITPEMFLLTPEEVAERFGLTLTQAKVALARSYHANWHGFEDVVEKSVGESVSIETLMSESYQRDLKEKLLVDSDRNMDAKQIAENLTDMIRLGILVGGYDYDKEARDKQIRLDGQTRERYAFFPEPGPPPGGGTVINTSNWLLPGLPHTFFAPGPGHGIDGLELLKESRERAIMNNEMPELEAFHYNGDHVAFDLVDGDWENVELHFTEDGIEKTTLFEPGMLSDARYFGALQPPKIVVRDVIIVHGTSFGDISKLLDESTRADYREAWSERRVAKGTLVIGAYPEDGTRRDQGDVRYGLSEFLTSS